MSEERKVRNISDLARIAGVSPGTVSRALSDSTLVNEKTRARIKALAREHDFRPSIFPTCFSSPCSACLPMR
ncbi:MAG: LacI family DNA-binding transcriptional regulator [Sphingomonadaceae bacterium]|nr:LacI family DNA-binding transcriptional regulator [Sphingomonadaceae bacterium]